jgi:hypothetical protein
MKKQLEFCTKCNKGGIKNLKMHNRWQHDPRGRAKMMAGVKKRFTVVAAAITPTRRKYRRRLVTAPKTTTKPEVFIKNFDASILNNIPLAEDIIQKCKELNQLLLTVVTA